jgi:hypothetical protein
MMHRRSLCKARWCNFYRNNAWVEQAQEEEANRREGDASTGLWKRQFETNEAKLTARHGMFFMTSNVRVGEIIGMHWFEPRYRWLAHRMKNEGDKTMVYCPGRPAVGAVSFICIPRQLEIMPDGRAMVELLPVAECVLKELWEEPVPGDPRAPKLLSAVAQEQPLERRMPPLGGMPLGHRARSGGAGGPAAAAAAAVGGGGGGDDDTAIADLLGGDNSAMNRFNGSAAELKRALLEVLFAHAEAHGVGSMAELVEGEHAAPRRLLELLAMLNDTSADDDGEDEDENEDEEQENEDEDGDEEDEDEGEAQFDEGEHGFIEAPGAQASSLPVEASTHNSAAPAWVPPAAAYRRTHQRSETP